MCPCLFALLAPVGTLMVGLAVRTPCFAFTGQCVTYVAVTLTAELDGSVVEDEVYTIESRVREIAEGVGTSAANQLHFVITGGGR